MMVPRIDVRLAYFLTHPLLTSTKGRRWTEPSGPGPSVTGFHASPANSGFPVRQKRTSSG